MPSNVKRRCAHTTKKSGKPCRRWARADSDSDGQFRCFLHTDDPHTRMRVAAECEGEENRREGREGKRRHVATARALATAQRAAGVGPAPGQGRGQKGLPLPDGVTVPKEGEDLIIPPELLEGGRRVPLERRGFNLAGHDLGTNTGRTGARDAVFQALAAGDIGPSEATAFVQLINSQAKDPDASAGRRTVAVRFATIETREQAEAYSEAQLIREGLN